MSKLAVTDFSKRSGSPFQAKKEPTRISQEEFIPKMQYEKQREKQNELIQKVNKKTAEYQSSKPSSGVFTEVVTHGAFTSKGTKAITAQERTPSPKANGLHNGSNTKSLLGFPSSANDLALDAKSDLESDANITKEVKDKVIDKLFSLVSMVQHMYESKVRVMTEFEKYKDTHAKNELRRERDHSEQLYRLNLSFQNEVVQYIQRLRSEMDISRNASESLAYQRNVLDRRNESADFENSAHLSTVSNNEITNNCENVDSENNK